MPDGLITMIKTATRALITACAAPGSTGPQRVEQLTGFSAGTISKWHGDAHPDVIPMHVVFLLEVTVQKPIFSRTLAALTGHQVVPMADGGPEASAGEFVSDVIRTTGSFSRYQQVMSEGLADGKITRGEAKAGLQAVLQHIDTLHASAQRLARAAEGVEP